MIFGISMCILLLFHIIFFSWKVRCVKRLITLKDEKVNSKPGVLYGHGEKSLYQGYELLWVISSFMFLVIAINLLLQNFRGDIVQSKVYYYFYTFLNFVMMVSGYSFAIYNITEIKHLSDNYDNTTYDVDRIGFFKNEAISGLAYMLTLIPVIVYIKFNIITIVLFIALIIIIFLLGMADLLQDDVFEYDLKITKYIPHSSQCFLAYIMNITKFILDYNYRTKKVHHFNSNLYALKNVLIK